MPNELRVRQNFIGGLVEDNPLATAATTLTSVALAAVPVIGTTQHYPIVLDPDGIDGEPEIVYVTAHLANASTATILRGQEGTIARAHRRDIPWLHGPTAQDFNDLPGPAWIAPGVFAITSQTPSLLVVASRYAAWHFDGAVAEEIAATWDMPASWSTINVDLYWTNPGTGTGNVTWEVLLDNAAAGASLAISGPSAVVTVAAPAQNVLAVSRMFTAQTLNASHLANVRIYRDPTLASDTLANDAAVLGVLITKAS